jgi:hypothetical protein
VTHFGCSKGGFPTKRSPFDREIERHFPSSSLRPGALNRTSHRRVTLPRPEGDSAKMSRGNVLVQRIVAETRPAPLFPSPGIVRSGPSQAGASPLFRPSGRPENGHRLGDRTPDGHCSLPACSTDLDVRKSARQGALAESSRPTRKRETLVLFSASTATHPRRPMKVHPNIPSRNPAVSRTPALELGGFSRDPMKRATAPVPGSSLPLRRLSVAISLGIAAQQPAGVLVRSDPGIPSGTSMKSLALKRRANRGFDPGEPPLASFRP